MDDLDHYLTPRHSLRAKRLSLKVNPKKNTIDLVIPKKAKQLSIERFVKANQDWIIDKYHALPQKIHPIDGEVIMFRGHGYRIRIINKKQRATSISISDDKLIVETSRDDISNNLKRWFINEAKTYIGNLATLKAQIIGKPIEKIDFRDTTSRWGSCSSSGRLMFSWRLIMAPDDVIDYVVAHEVAHLVHMDHSRQFWDVCYQLSHEAEWSRQWLNANGNTLLNIF